jgi:catechol 2,3-dioxygenase-like lactoylglutathione lyase family enzyme
MRIVSSDPVLAVQDLARSTDWYVRVLGCEAIEVDPGNWTFCRNGGVAFHLGRCPDAAPASDIGDHNYLAYLFVDDVDAFHQRAVREGAEVLKAPRDEPWGRREMAVRSPDGHRFMLAQ